MNVPATTAALMREQFPALVANPGVVYPEHASNVFPRVSLQHVLPKCGRQTSPLQRPVTLTRPSRPDHPARRTLRMVAAAGVIAQADRRAAG